MFHDGPIKVQVTDFSRRKMVLQVTNHIVQHASTPVSDAEHVLNPSRSKYVTARTAVSSQELRVGIETFHLIRPMQM
jgi:hypothetical protein